MRPPPNPSIACGRRRAGRTRAASVVSALLVGLLAGGCRGGPGTFVAPTPGPSQPAAVAGGGPRRPELQPVVPRVQRLFARSDGNRFMLVALFDVLGTGRPPPFSPTEPGGWCFQLFLDVDGDSTGYSGAGLDYVLRSMEIDARGLAPLRRTEGGTGPGGWGETVALVPVGPTSRQLMVSIPLEALGPDDGRLDFVLEMYETVAGESGVVHRFAGNYEGTSTTGPDPRPLVAHRGGAVARFALRMGD